MSDPARQLHVAVDCDDVLVDFWPRVLRCFNTEFGANLAMDEQNDWGDNPIKRSGHFGPGKVYPTWWEWWRDRHWLWATCDAIPGAIGGLKAMGERGYTVELVTHKPEWARREMTSWLAKWHPHFDRLTLVSLEDSKAEATDATVLIDDKPQNVTEWVQSSTDRSAILFTRPWNLDFEFPANVHRADDWAEVLDTLETLEDLEIRSGRLWETLNKPAPWDPVKTEHSLGIDPGHPGGIVHFTVHDRALTPHEIEAKAYFGKPDPEEAEIDREADASLGEFDEDNITDEDRYWMDEDAAWSDTPREAEAFVPENYYTLTEVLEMFGLDREELQRELDRDKPEGYERMMTRLLSEQECRKEAERTDAEMRQSMDEEFKAVHGHHPDPSTPTFHFTHPPGPWRVPKSYPEPSEELVFQGGRWQTRTIVERNLAIEDIEETTTPIRPSPNERRSMLVDAPAGEFETYTARAREHLDSEEKLMPVGGGILIGVCGYQGAGKDTIGKLLVEHYGFTRRAFADPLKDCALAALEGYACDAARYVREHGWDKAKRENPRFRRFLQRFGVGVRDLDADFWARITIDKIEPGERTVVTDVRFPNEVDRIRWKGGFIWRVDRPGHGSDGHASEQAESLDADLVIPNAGTLDDLLKRVQHEMGNLAIDPKP